jgi:hypothetical protein
MPCIRRQVRLVPVVSAVLAAAVFTAPARGAIILDNLVIRVYDNAGIPVAVRTTMLRQAAEILVHGEPGLAWLVCPSRRLAFLPRSCDRAPGPYELVVRLTESPRPAAQDDRRALGFSLVDPANGSGLSTVYVDRVDWLAREARVDRATVLARALAHELSHLLFGSNDHTAVGLLRERWTADELTRNRPEDWQLSPAQRNYARTQLTKVWGSRAAAKTGRAGKVGPGG